MELTVECNNGINNEKCFKIHLLRKENKCRWGPEEREGGIEKETRRERERERRGGME